MLNSLESVALAVCPRLNTLTLAMYKLTSGVGLSGILLLICFLTPESVVGKGKSILFVI